MEDKKNVAQHEKTFVICFNFRKGRIVEYFRNGFLITRAEYRLNKNKGFTLLYKTLYTNGIQSHCQGQIYGSDRFSIDYHEKASMANWWSL